MSQIFSFIVILSHPSQMYTQLHIKMHKRHLKFYVSNLRGAVIKTNARLLGGVVVRALEL